MSKESQNQLNLNSEKSRLGWYEACERCRRRHVRCQRKAGHLPCNNCKKAKTKCAGRKGDVFRAVHYSSGSGENALTCSRQLSATAIDQPSPITSTATCRNPASVLEITTIEAQGQTGTPASPGFRSVSAQDAWSREESSRFLEPASVHPDLAEGSTLEISTERPVTDSSQPLLFQADIQTFPPFSSVQSSTSQNSIHWPLKTEFEASLFQHFLIELSPWFDYCDPQKYFRNHVANSAVTDSTLLYAIFAVSARHQSASSNKYLIFAEECQQSCLNSLICALADRESTIGENVFASALILRLIEEMTGRPFFLLYLGSLYFVRMSCQNLLGSMDSRQLPVPQPGSNVDSHPLSAQLLIRIKAGNITESIFTGAEFLVTLRQEIFISNLTQRPVGSIAEHCNIDTSLNPASDPMWAYRTMALAAKATDFAYGDNEYRTKNQWTSLMEYLHDWEAMRPPSFQPIFQIPGTFPKLLFCSDYHVAASHYTELSRILLLASDPSVPQIRIGRLGGRKHDHAIRESVRLICGVALANRQYMPARSTAGLAVSMCGELFNDEAETRVLLELLADAESHLGWPCLKLKDELQRLWGLSN